MMTGAAMAQTTIIQTTQPIAPPDGTLSVTHSEKTLNSDGSQSQSNSTTYRSGNGVATDSSSSTTYSAPPPPPPPPTTTTTTTTNTSSSTTE